MNQLWPAILQKKRKKKNIEKRKKNEKREKNRIDRKKNR